MSGLAAQMYLISKENAGKFDRHTLSRSAGNVILLKKGSPMEVHLAIGEPCYASFPLHDVKVIIQPFKNHLSDICASDEEAKKVLKAWLGWLFKRSPYKGAYVTTNVAKCIDAEGVAVRLSEYNNKAYCALCAIRYLSEGRYPSIVYSWYKLTRRGVDPMVALYFAHRHPMAMVKGHLTIKKLMLMSGHEFMPLLNHNMARRLFKNEGVVFRKQQSLNGGVEVHHGRSYLPNIDIFDISFNVLCTKRIEVEGGLNFKVPYDHLPEDGLKRFVNEINRVMEAL